MQLKLFHGGTMNTYTFPSRITEVIFCKDTAVAVAVAVTVKKQQNTNTQTINNRSCSKHGYDPDSINIPTSLFEVRVSKVENGGQGVFCITSYTLRTHNNINTCFYYNHFPDVVATAAIDIVVSAIVKVVIATVCHQQHRMNLLHSLFHHRYHSTF
jgi:hypothetical protein